MTTEATIQPIEAFREARTALLDTFLGAVSGLEGSVLDFEQEHQRRLSAAQTDAATARAEAARYKELLGRQTAAIEAAEAHVCPEPADGRMQEAESAAAAGDEEAEAEISRLRGELSDAEGTIRQLREDLAAATAKAERLELDREQPEASAGTEALEAEHAQQIAAIASGFEARVQENYRAARSAAHTEAAGIVQALAADNPALPLSEAAELFAEAFDAAPDDEHEIPASAAPSAAEEDARAEAAEQPVVETAPVAAAQPGAPFDDFFTDPAPAPMTQAMPDLPAAQADGPFGGEDPFFEDEAPAAVPEPVPAAEPRPGFALFGRKKEEATA